MVQRPARNADRLDDMGGTRTRPHKADQFGVSRTSPKPEQAAPPPRSRLLLVATLLTLFAILATVVRWDRRPILGDGWIGVTLLRQPNDLAWRLADAITFCASGSIVALVAVACAAWLAIARRELLSGLAVLVAPAAAGVVEIGMKSIVGRPRPFTAAISGETGDGFPSGHVAGYAALVVALLVAFVLSTPGCPRVLRRVWTANVIVGIVLVMWSRVALGAHYASDTVGGALLGAGIGLCALPAVAAVARQFDRARSRSLKSR
jgi:membrane-associated phospholipid phosphatase